MLLKKLFMINWLNNIDTSYFFLKTKYQTDKAELEKKIRNVTLLRKQNSLN